MGLPIVAVTLILILTITNNSVASLLSFKNEYVSRESRITNGAAITITEAPYMASIQMKYINIIEGFGAGAICGGAVVSQRMVITAARCFTNFQSTSQQIYPASSYVVVVGTTYVNRNDIHTLQYNIQKLVVYPKFNLTTPLYDMAAVFIDGYIPWNWPTAKALPINFKGVPIGTNCSVVGWQLVNLLNTSSALTSLTIPIRNNTECSPITGNVTIPQSLICAGNLNVSVVNACIGDSGDPLVCNGYLTGIVANANGCYADRFTGYYGNVSDFYNWITQTNASFNYNTYGGAIVVNIYSKVMVFISIIIAIILNY